MPVHRERKTLQQLLHVRHHHAPHAHMWQNIPLL
jgi:hypothetical protein